MSASMYDADDVDDVTNHGEVNAIREAGHSSAAEVASDFAFGLCERPDDQPSHSAAGILEVSTDCFPGPTLLRVSARFFNATIRLTSQ